MDLSLDAFIGVSERSTYHPDGSEHGSGISGAFAKKADALGHILTTPMSLCIDRYVRIFVVPIKPGYYGQKSTSLLEVAYRVALFAINTITALIVLAPTLIGTLLRVSTYSAKKDFIWQGPKEKQPSEDTQDLDKNTISLMTYNMAAMPQFISTRNLLRPTMERAQEIPDALAATEELPDFICGQEVFHTQATEAIAEGLKQKGYSSIVRNVGPKICGLNSGLFLASKYRLSNVCFYPHAYTRGFIERQANKGVLIATAHIGKKLVVIANTHLSGGAPGGGALPRSAQVKGVMAHIDRYVQKMLTENQKIEGVFLSADTNIAPIDTSECLRDDNGHLTISQEPEWYLNPMLHARSSTGFLSESSNTPKNSSQEIAKQTLMNIQKTLPNIDQITDPNAWNHYIHAVKTIQNGDLCPNVSDPSEFLKKELPHKLGGPLPPDLYEHDLDSLEKAMDGSVVDMEFSSPTHLNTNDLETQSAVTKPLRLDFNFVRTRKGFTNSDYLGQPKSLGSKVIHLRRTPSDHHPVRTIFSIANNSV